MTHCVLYAYREVSGFIEGQDKIKIKNLKKYKKQKGGVYHYGNDSFRRPV